MSLNCDLMRNIFCFYFRVSEICHNYGLEMACWEDGLYSDSHVLNQSILLNKVTYANVWDNVWEWGAGGRAYQLANAGYKVNYLTLESSNLN